MNSLPSPPAISYGTWHGLLAALALVIAPHVLRLPVWVTAGCLLAAAWRLLNLHRNRALPGRGTRLLLTGAALAGLWLSYGNPFGRDPGIAMLIMMLGLKLLEMRSRRDVMVTVFMAYFLVITNFLHSQSMFMAVYMLGAVLAITATLIEQSRSTTAPQASTYRWRANLRLAGTLLAQAVPLMVVLFVLFPRVSGPLWGLPRDAYAGMAGLSDSMAPGSINQLVLSEKIAFRVAFDGEVPSPEQRYWRGPVFWHTDGRRWSAGTVPENAPPPEVEPRGPRIDYTVTIEPHNRNWVFALDLPAQAPEGTIMSGDFQLLAASAVLTRRRYTLASFPAYRVTSLSAADRARAVQLPLHSNPRARALAATWRDSFTEDRAVVGEALHLFQEQPFVYTLTPPLLGEDVIDGFLFDTRQGFCEHYAASFVFLMRATGIPARVVTGYLGGTLNPVGDYLAVRQSDAHAWAEVWLDGDGWVRIDPTAAVAPERIERGIAVAAQREGAPVRFRTPPQVLANAWRVLRDGWDAVSNAWNQWVLDYTPQRQADLLERLGLGEVSWRGMAVALGLACAGLLGVIAAYMLLRRPAVVDPVLFLYQRFCAKLARRGITRAPAEGPADFGTRAGALRPEAAAQIRLITGLYIRLRYGSGGTYPPLLESLHRHVRNFR